MTGLFHSLPYPCLEEGNLSYPSGSYKGEPIGVEEGSSVKINHQLSNAKFIQQQVIAKRAEYGCLISAPDTGHRELQRSSEPIQIVEWNTESFGEPPIIRPIVVAVQSFVHVFSPEDDVDEIWIGKTIEIPKGARLARDAFLKSSSNMQSLLNPKLDEDLPKGSFRVRPESDHGYRFIVWMAKDIFWFVEHRDRDIRLYHSLAVQMVSACLSLLKEEENWKEYSSLRSLADKLDSENIELWDQDDFRPELAACKLYPLLVPEADERDGQGEY